VTSPLSIQPQPMRAETTRGDHAAPGDRSTTLLSRPRRLACRRRSAGRSLALATGLLLGLASGRALAEDAPAPTTALVLSNVPAQKGGVDWGRAEGVVEGRVDDVASVLLDYGRYAGLFPYFQKSKVLSQRGSDAIVYLEAKVLHGAATLWGQVRMRVREEPSGARVIEAQLMPGKGNVSQLLARWEVTPVDAGRTRVAFQILVDPDLPVPDVVVSREMKKGAGQAFRALRDRVQARSSVASRAATAL
jgi:ribosome-associated toxin RatA of RatAB toxin-antitoxin module